MKKLIIVLYALVSTLNINTMQKKNSEDFTINDILTMPLEEFEVFSEILAVPLEPFEIFILKNLKAPIQPTFTTAITVTSISPDEKTDNKIVTESSLPKSTAPTKNKKLKKSKNRSSSSKDLFERAMQKYAASDKKRSKEIAKKIKKTKKERSILIERREYLLIAFKTQKSVANYLKDKTELNGKYTVKHLKNAFDRNKETCKGCKKGYNTLSALNEKNIIYCNAQTDYDHAEQAFVKLSYLDKNKTKKTHFFYHELEEEYTRA